MPLSRRAALAAFATAAGACLHGCSQADPAEQAAARKQVAGPAGPGWHDLSFPASSDLPEGQLAAVYAPAGSAEWPVVIALHGRGEAGRGLPAGAHGWRDDYHVDLVRARLEKNELGSADAKGMLAEERLATIRASLAKDAYRGVVLACPYTPVPSGRDQAASRPFGRFLTEVLLPKVAEIRGGAIARDRTGIDGVSMGGRYALQIGFGFGDRFGSVGALQPAISEEEAGDFARLAAAAPRQRIRLASSEGDPFLEPTRALDRELTANQLEHQLVVTAGPHDYVWNQGPGSVELLLFHERALRGLTL